MIHQIDYYSFVYKWTDSTNNKIYIGSHHGSVEDGYTGSGVFFCRAYNKRAWAFARTILEYNIIDCVKTTRNIEQKYLSNINFKESYNISKNACGGYLLDGYSKEHQQYLMEKRIKAIPKGNDHHQYGKSLSIETRTKISNTLKGNIPWNKGRSDLGPSYNSGCKGLHYHSDTTKEKISNALTGTVFTNERKNNISKSLKGKKKSEAHKKSIRDARKNISYDKAQIEYLIENIQTGERYLIISRNLNNFCAMHGLNYNSLMAAKTAKRLLFNIWKISCR